MTPVEQRLAHIEAQQERILAMLEALAAKVEDRIDSTDRWREKTDTMMYGENGTKGVLTRLDRIEQAHERSRWVVRAIGTAVITLLVGALFALLR